MNDRTNEVSLLPYCERATILSISMDPPTKWPNGAWITDTSPFITWDEHANQLWEQLGLWVDRTHLSPFCVVRLELDTAPNEMFDDGRSCPWQVVPASIIWPAAGMRVIRRATQLKAQENLEKLLRWLNEQTPLGLGAIEFVGAIPILSRSHDVFLTSRGSQTKELIPPSSIDGLARDALRLGEVSEPIRSICRWQSANAERPANHQVAQCAAQQTGVAHPSYVIKRKGPPLSGIANKAALSTEHKPSMAGNVAAFRCARTPVGMTLTSISPSSATSSANGAASGHNRKFPPPRAHNKPFSEKTHEPAVFKRPAPKPKAPGPPRRRVKVGTVQVPSDPTSTSTVVRAFVSPSESAVERIDISVPILVTDSTALALMKVPLLKQQCALRNLKVSGTRAQLLERLGVA